MLSCNWRSSKLIMGTDSNLHDHLNLLYFWIPLSKTECSMENVSNVFQNANLEKTFKKESFTVLITEERLKQCFPFSSYFFH